MSKKLDTLLGTGLVYLITRNVTRALSVLMVDFSCALKLAMPISVLSAILVGLRSSIKHFKGEGGCGGGSTSVKRKRLKNVIAVKTIGIEGMSCEHCKNRVEQRINELDGASAKVNLRKKQAVVSLAKDVSEERICAAIEKAGYQVTEIQSRIL